MDYDELADFIQNKMQMTHVYQPILIRTLLRNNGRATARQVAMEFLRNDPAQLDYYIEVVNRWPRSVLKGHGIIGETGRGNRNRTFMLRAGGLSGEQMDMLARMCDERLEAYKKSKGVTLHFDRVGPRKGISGSTRYKVISKSGGRCVACGVPSTERRLEVDHIVPLNRGGANHISNLQPLCYKCNSQKRDRDDLDFLLEHNRQAFGRRGCRLCGAEKIAGVENPLAGALFAPVPKADLHAMVLPKRHVPNFFSLRPPEASLLINLISPLQESLRGMDKSIRDFSVMLDADPHVDDSYHCFIDVVPIRAR